MRSKFGPSESKRLEKGWANFMNFAPGPGIHVFFLNMFLLLHIEDFFMKCLDFSSFGI